MAQHLSELLASNPMLMLYGIALGLGPALVVPWLLLRWRVRPWAIIGLGFAFMMVSALVRPPWDRYPLGFDRPHAFWIFTAERFCFSLGLACNWMAMRRMRHRPAERTQHILLARSSFRRKLESRKPNVAPEPLDPGFRRGDE